MSMIFRYSEERLMAIIAILSALLLAAHEVNVATGMQFISKYVYWFFRIFIESSLFVTILYAFEKIMNQRATHFWVYICSMFISLLVFTLAVISFDLILGFPELGLDVNNKMTSSYLQELGLEVIYLLDNHMVLCALLLLPRLFLSRVVQEQKNSIVDRQLQTPQLFFDAIDPPLEGHICHIEAQEHYICITTTQENRMILYRFSDAIREMPNTQGMQVHRSHWVAYAAVEGILKEGQNVKLKLFENNIVPVSRPFSSQVKQKFA